MQKTKGTGPISDPIANFDGICLPFGPPCDQASSCSCLPPDTNGEVGATRYVQIVNSDFAVYSKAGATLRGATPINQRWAGTNSECATHNEGDPCGRLRPVGEAVTDLRVHRITERRRAVRRVHRSFEDRRCHRRLLPLHLPVRLRHLLDYPSVRYTGRAVADPLGQLAQAEKVAFTGTGPQTEVEGRWGDYSDLTADPTNDCTFFYTTEYLAEDTVVIGTWRTRVVSFRFPGCK